MFSPVVLLCALLAQTQSSVLVTTHPGADEVSLWGYGQQDGKYFEYVVSEARFAKVPEWAPEKQIPPLAITKAIEVAKQATRAEHPEFKELFPWNISINQASSRDAHNRWFYVIEFYPLVNGQPSPFTHVTALVLMDGGVVKPREQKPLPK
jgi:hypothetical protein